MSTRRVLALVAGTILLAATAVAQTTTTQSTHEVNPTLTTRVPDELNPPARKTGPTAPRPLAAAPVLRNGAVPTGISGFYDYQSNGMMRGRFIASPANPNQLHVVAMRATNGADQNTVSATRRVGYAVSNDGGVTWSLVDDIDRGFRLGFPSLAILPDGTPLVAAHGDPNSEGVQTMTYAGDGSGFFRLANYARPTESGRTGDGGAGVIWPAWVVDPGNGQRTVLMATLSNSSGTGPAPLQVAAADVGSTAPWRTIADSSLSATSGGRNPMAVSASGKIGVAYYKSGGIADAGIYFSESSDGGNTWSTPIKCVGFDYTDGTFGPEDTARVSTNLDLVYNGDEPMVTCNGSRAGLYAAQRIYFWTPTGGARSIAIADSNIGLGLILASRLAVQSNMDYLSYPTISVGDDGRHVLVAFQAAAQVSTDSAPAISEHGFYYFRIWGVGSNDGGVTWGDPFIIQDFAGDGTDSASLEYPTALARASVVGDKFIHRLIFHGRRYPGMYAFIVEDTDGNGTPANRGPFAETFVYYQQSDIDTARMYAKPASAPHQGAPMLTTLFPNPARDLTRLGIDLKNPGSLTVSIVDQLGRELGRPVDAEIRANGFHTVNIPTAGLPVGSYRIVVRSGSGLASLPLTVVR